MPTYDMEAYLNEITEALLTQVPREGADNEDIDAAVFSVRAKRKYPPPAAVQKQNLGQRLLRLPRHGGDRFTVENL